MGCKLPFLLTALVCFHLVIANQNDELNRNWFIDQLCKPIISVCNSVCGNELDQILENIKLELSSVKIKLGVESGESKLFKEALFGLEKVIDQELYNFEKNRADPCSHCQELHDLCN